MHGKNGHPFKHALGADLGVNDVLEHKLLPAHQQGLNLSFVVIFGQGAIWDEEKNSCFSKEAQTFGKKKKGEITYI